MNSQKFTHKMNEALVSTHEFSLNSGHIALALVFDPNTRHSPLGRFQTQAATTRPPTPTSSCSSRSSLRPPLRPRRWRRSLPGPPSSRSSAQSSWKSCDDSHLVVDQLILGLLEDSQIGDILKEAEVSMMRVKAKVENLKGKEGRKVESAFRDTNF